MKHKKHKISTQLSAGFAVIVLITISVISLTANLLISHQFEKYVARQRETFAEQLITTLLSQYNSSNQTWNLDYIHGVGMYALKDGYIIKVYDKDKNIIWDAENHDITLCHQIMKDIHTNMEKKRPGLKGSFSTYHYTLSQDNKIAGYADISYYGPYYFSESDFQFLDSLNQILFITGISSLILAVIAGMLLAKRLSVPLTKAKETAEKIADGNYQIRYGSDKANTTALELAQLGQAIDHMAENLEKQEEVRRQLTSDVAHELRTPVANVSSQLEAVRPPISTIARLFVVVPLNAIGIMETTVVSVVIRIGRIRVAPASIRAVSRFMVPRYWFAVSTNKIPLFTTVPISIRKPMRETMLMEQSVSHNSPNAPIRLNGIVVMTIPENLIDSNWAAITTKIKNTAIASALNRDANSSFLD